MVNYSIKASYSTGDSFSNWDKADIVSAFWTDIEQAKKALKWMTEHHKYYLANDHNSHSDKLDISDLKSKPWYRKNPNTSWQHDDFWTYSLFLELDNGSLHTESIQYHGYFDNLESLEIIVEEGEDNSDMRSTF